VKSRWLKVLRLCCITIFVLGLLGLGLLTWFWLALQNPENQKQIAQEISLHLPEPWRSRAKIGKIGGRLPGSFFISELQMDLSLGDQFRLQNIELYWDWRALWHRKIKIHRIQISHLVATIHQDANGEWLKELLDHGPAPTSPPEESTETMGFPQVDFQLSVFRVDSLQVNLQASQEPWKQLQLTVPNVLLDINLAHLSEELSIQMNTSLNSELSIDNYPKGQLDFKAQAKSSSKGLTLTLEKLKVSSGMSQILLNANVSLPKDWWTQLNDMENLCAGMKAEINIVDSQLRSNEMSPYLPEELKLPGDIQWKAQVQILEKHIAVKSSVKSGHSQVKLEYVADELFLNPDQDSCKLKVTGSGNIEDWLTELVGHVVLDFEVNGVPNQLSQVNLKNKIEISGVSFNNEACPSLKIMTELEASQGHSRLELMDKDGSANLTITPSFVAIEKWSDIDLRTLPLEISQSANVIDLNSIGKKIQNIFGPEISLEGALQQNLSLKGSLGDIQYSISVDTQGLVVDRPYPAEIHGEVIGHIDGSKFLEPLPEFPLVFQTGEHLKQDVQVLGVAVQEWLALLEWPMVTLRSSGNQLYSKLDGASLQLTPGPAKSFDLIMLAHGGGEVFLDTQLKVSPKPDQVELSIARFKCNPTLLLSQPWPWAEQAFILQQVAEVKLHWAEAKLSWNGFDFGSDHWFVTHGEGQIDGLWESEGHVLTPDLSEILSALELNLPFQCFGRVRLDISSKGTWRRPEHILDLQSTDMVFKKTDVPSLELEKVRVQLHQISEPKGLITLEAEVIPKGDAGFSLAAHLPLVFKDPSGLPDWQQMLEFELGPKDGKAMGLHRFAPLLDGVIQQLEGGWYLKLKGQVDLLSPSVPQFEGELSLQNVKGKLVSIPQSIDDLNVKLLLSPTQVQLKTLALNNKEGSISGEGIASAANLMAWDEPQWDLHFLIKEWKTKLPPQLSVISGANLSWSGNSSQHRIFGETKVSELVYKPEINFFGKEQVSGLDPHIAMTDVLVSWEEIDAKKAREPNSPASQFFKNAQVKILIKLDKNNWIRNDMFTGEVHGALSVEKAFGQEELHPKGKVNLQRAVLRFQGKRFTMEKGDLIWQGELIPAINMAFNTHVEPYDIQILLQADQADLVKPELSSRPWLDNSDIISVLLVGRPLHAESKTAEKSDSMGQDLAVSQGVAQLSKQLGLQDMGIEFEEVNSKGGTVRIGRYLHPRLYLSVAKTMGEEENQELSLEFLILKNLRFKTTQETETPLGFDLEWTLDY
jgi:hypothetical protein